MDNHQDQNNDISFHQRNVSKKTAKSYCNTQGNTEIASSRVLIHYSLSFPRRIFEVMEHQYELKLPSKCRVIVLSKEVYSDNYIIRTLHFRLRKSFQIFEMTVIQIERIELNEWINEFAFGWKTPSGLSHFAFHQTAHELVMTSSDVIFSTKQSYYYENFSQYQLICPRISAFALQTATPYIVILVSNKDLLPLLRTIKGKWKVNYLKLHAKIFTFSPRSTWAKAILIARSYLSPEKECFRNGHCRMSYFYILNLN